MDTFTKQPSEQYKIYLEWSGKLPVGSTVSSCTVTAYNQTDGVDATATVLQSSAAEISGTQTRVVVQSGNNGKNYKLTFVMNTVDGQVLEEDILMQVVDE